MVEQIEQLKAMREEAHKRLEQKREVLKKQMYVLATSSDAKLIKSLNPLIENLEKTLAKNIEAQKLEASKLALQEDTKSNVLPLHPQNDMDKTAEDALVKALNAATSINSKPVEATSIEVAPIKTKLIETVEVAPATVSVPLTQAQRTQSELENIAAQLRENISQDRSI